MTNVEEGRGQKSTETLAEIFLDPLIFSKRIVATGILMTHGTHQRFPTQRSVVILL